MIRIGEYNRLRAARRTDFGLYLTDGEQEVLLPRRFVPEEFELGESLRVFVTTDSEDRPVATTQRPLGVVGEFAGLTVKQVTGVGAFMDWGLDKDLLVPFAEQHRKLEEGVRYLVRIARDERTNRVYGSTRLGKFLQNDPSLLREGMEVPVVIGEPGPVGTRVVIDNAFFGMIFPDEIHERLKVGERRVGYIKRIREDGGIAISLTRQGFHAAVEEGDSILDKLRNAKGFLPYGDRSAPDDIRREFGMSKATFKKAIGALMKAGHIDIEEHGIRLRTAKRPK